MNLKIKNKGFFGDKRTESETEITDIVVKEDILNPEGEKYSIYFKGEESSGIITLRKEEYERLLKTLQKKKIVKKSKIIMG